jgi:hypothetical protein
MRTLTRLSLFAAMPLLFLALTVPSYGDTKATPKPNTKVGTATFTGIVQHVSTQNIKVQDPKTKQSLSFVILPKFNQVFSDDGKTTYQMTDVKAGRYVKVYYDQKLLGSRHADRILLLNQGNQVLRKE